VAALFGTTAVAARSHGRDHGRWKRTGRTPRLARTSAEDSLQAFQDLGEWLIARGATISPAVGVTQDDATGGGRGCAAADNIREGEVILDLPLACCLAAPPGAEVMLRPIGTALEAAGLVADDAALTIALAEERSLGESSPWWPYIRLVGEPAQTFPCLYAEGDLEELQSQPLEESLLALRQAVEAIASFRGLPIFSVAAALQLVRSRRFGCEMGRFMLPLGDMLNHSFQPTCVWEKPVLEGRQSWRLVAVRDIQQGEPINFCYCSDPNHLLLSTNGFIVPKNPFSRIMVKPKDIRHSLLAVCEEEPGASASADFVRWRKEEIERALADFDVEEDGPGVSMFLVGRKGAGTQWNPLWLNLCGMAIAKDAQGPHWSQRTGGCEEYLSALERASWGVFRTTQEEDGKAAKVSGLTENQQLALQFRLEQKEVMAEALSSFRQQIKAAATQATLAGKA